VNSFPDISPWMQMFRSANEMDVTRGFLCVAAQLPGGSDRAYLTGLTRWRGLGRPGAHTQKVPGVSPRSSSFWLTTAAGYPLGVAVVSQKRFLEGLQPSGTLWV